MEYYNEFALKCRAERLKSTTKPKIPKYDYPGREEYKAIPSIEARVLVPRLSQSSILVTKC